MKLRQKLFIILALGLGLVMSTTVHAQMPKRLPAKAPVTYSETDNSEVFDVRLKPNPNPPSSNFDYEDALKNTDKPKNTKTKPSVASKQLVSYPKRNVGSVAQPAIRLHKAKSKPKARK